MKKNSKKEPDNKVIRIILVIILIISVGVILGSISYIIYNYSQIHSYSNNIISQRNIDTSVQVSTRNGINGDTDALKFGITTPGGGGTRFIDINSTQKALVNLYLSGNISNYLSAEKNNFTIEPGEFVHLPINLEIPEDAPFGNYDGIITVILTRP